MTTRATNHEIETLSAYLDEQLSASERVQVENMVQQNSELNELLADMRQLRTLLRSQPHPRAPRNFTLTPIMIGEHRTRTVPLIWFQRMRLVSALASFAFIFVLLGDLLGLGGRVAAPLMASVPAMEAAPTLSQELSLQQEAALPAEALTREAAPQAAAPLEAPPAEVSSSDQEVQATQPVEDAMPAAKMVAPSEVPPEATPEAALMLEAAPYPLPATGAGGSTLPDENTPPALSKMAPQATPTLSASAVAQTEPDAGVLLGEAEDSSLAAPVAEERQGARVGPFAWSSLHPAALLLAILAVVSGLISFVFWQKSRA